MGTIAEPAPNPAAEKPPRVAVVGIGVMGLGIAIVFARAGSEVTLVGRREAALTQAQQELATRLQTLEAAAGPIIATRERISMTLSIKNAVGEADLVVESIAEETEQKQRLFAQVERHAPAEAILASNTSSLPLAELSGGLRHPGRFAAMHWFNPPELVQLVEIVAAPKTDPETITKLRRWTLQVGQTPLVLKRDVPGFVANRLQYALYREAYALVSEGVCSHEDFERALALALAPRWSSGAFLSRIHGPSLPLHYRITELLFPTLASDSEPPPALRALREPHDPETEAAPLDQGWRLRYAEFLLAIERLRRTLD
jgi:3-hydroxybutyryl-CoA dehydrogenase